MRHRITLTAVIAATGVACISGCNGARPHRPAVEVRLASSSETRPGDSRPGLLIVAHGSPSEVWNRPLLELEREVKRELGSESAFHAVKLAFMEFASPTVADGVKALEESGCDRLVVAPLLVAPSSHSQRDVPSLLGTYADEETSAALAAEGATPVRSKLPITITPTMDHGELFEEVLEQRVRELSRDPANEAIVVLAHGDEAFEPIWSDRMRKLVTYLCGKTGITYGDYAFVHVGQAYSVKGAPVIAAATKNRRRVLVVGCYLSMGAKGMHERFMRTGIDSPFPMLNPLAGKDIAAAERGLLPDARVAQWVVRTASQALE